MINRAQDFDFARFKQILSQDGNLSSAEKLHLNIVESMFQKRLETLKGSSGVFKKLIGLTR